MKDHAKRSYSEKLKDPRWQKKRLEVLERDNWTCRICYCKEETLHVHHITYERGREPWDYDDGNFLTLCETCHDRVTIVTGNVGRLLTTAQRLWFFYNLLRLEDKAEGKIVDSLLDGLFAFAMRWFESGKNSATEQQPK